VEKNGRFVTLPGGKRPKRYCRNLSTPALTDRLPKLNMWGSLQERIASLNGIIYGEPAIGTADE
jgi:hypothetical protein